MSIPGFSISKPDWYARAEKSGAVDVVSKDTTILGYVPYQRAKQVSIISGLGQVILYAYGSNDTSLLIVSGFSAIFSLCFYRSYINEKVEIVAVHNRIMEDKEDRLATQQ